MLALKMRAGMVSVSWGIEGVLIVLLALAVKERSFRLTGLGILCSASQKSWPSMLGLQARDRYITLIIVVRRWYLFRFSTPDTAMPFVNFYETLRCLRRFFSHPGIRARRALLEPAPPQVHSRLGQRHLEYGRRRPARSLARPMHFTRLSDEREIDIGKKLASRYATQTRKLTPEEEGLEKYVTRVGGTVALRAHRHLP